MKLPKKRRKQSPRHRTIGLPPLLNAGQDREDVWVQAKKPRVPSKQATLASYNRLHAVSPPRSVVGLRMDRRVVPGERGPQGASLTHAADIDVEDLDGKGKASCDASDASDDVNTPGSMRSNNLTKMSARQTLSLLSSNTKNVRKFVGRERRQSNTKEGNERTAPPGLPFDRTAYDVLKAKFSGADRLSTGKIGWAQLQTLAIDVSCQVDYRSFKRFDKDRCGTVDFEGTLRLFFPKTKGSDIKWVSRNWGGEPEKIDDKPKEKDDTDAKLPASVLNELHCIFELYTGLLGGHTDAAWEGTPVITKAQLLHAMKGALGVITESDICSLFCTYAVAYQDALTFTEFVSLMESVIGGHGSSANSTVQYSYTSRPLPMPEL